MRYVGIGLLVGFLLGWVVARQPPEALPDVDASDAIPGEINQDFLLEWGNSPAVREARAKHLVEWAILKLGMAAEALERGESTADVAATLSHDAYVLQESVTYSFDERKR